MTRGIWTKWIFVAAFLLLIVAVGCFLWYQHTTAPYKTEADKDEKMLKQWEADKAKPTITAEKESTQAPAENTTSTAEKPTNKIGDGKETNTDKSTQPVNIATSKQDDTEEVKVSPYGFGPYPKVPDDYPGDFGRKGEVDWAYRHSPNKELLTRVLIKLWTEGEKNFIGGSTHRGKVYPHYFDTRGIQLSMFAPKSVSASLGFAAK